MLCAEFLQIFDNFDKMVAAFHKIFVITEAGTGGRKQHHAAAAALQKPVRLGHSLFQSGGLAQLKIGPGDQAAGSGGNLRAGLVQGNQHFYLRVVIDGDGIVVVVLPGVLPAGNQRQIFGKALDGADCGFRSRGNAVVDERNIIFGRHFLQAVRQGFKIFENLRRLFKVQLQIVQIEQIKNSFHSQAISPFLLSSLHQSAKIAQTHYSTRIEGNNLSLQQVEQTLHSANHDAKKYQGHDQKEVRSYYNAIDYMEKYLEEGAPFTESFVQKIHTLIEGQKKTIPYRDSQNAIYDSSDGSLVYLPPETQDVPTMMRDLTIWVNENITQLPTPIVAGLFHYQFVTIHPYFDGNGRTARLITSYLMRKFGYGLQGIYSLEEYYAQNLGEYYQALATHPHHNYYFGRDKADLSNWLAYFIHGVAQAFTKVIAHAEQISCPDTTAVDRKSVV